MDIARRPRRLRCPCGWSTCAVHNRSEPRWRGLDLGATKLFLRGENWRRSTGAAAADPHRSTTTHDHWRGPACGVGNSDMRPLTPPQLSTRLVTCQVLGPR